VCGGQQSTKLFSGSMEDILILTEYVYGFTAFLQGAGGEYFS